MAKLPTMLGMKDITVQPSTMVGMDKDITAQPPAMAGVKDITAQSPTMGMKDITAQPPTMADENFPPNPEGFIQISFGYHVTEQHARDIVKDAGDTVGGVELKEMREMTAYLDEGGNWWETYLLVNIAVEPSRTQNLIDILRTYESANIVGRGSPSYQTEEIIHRSFWAF